MAVKIIKCPWCEGEARITYEENRVYQMKCYSCHNTMLHVDHSFDSAVEFFEHHANLLQAENEGRMVIMPCKVGDVVYGFHQERTILPMVAKWIETDTDGWTVAAQYTPMAPKFYLFSDFGKTVFLTREEAEAALAWKG